MWIQCRVLVKSFPNTRRPVSVVEQGCSVPVLTRLSLVFRFEKIRLVTGGMNVFVSVINNPVLALNLNVTLGIRTKTSLP